MRPGQAESTEAYDRPWKRVSTAALSLGAEEEQPTARVPGAGGCKGLILLRPLNAGRRLFPRKATCGWFWYFCHQKYRESRDDVAGVLYLFSAKSTDRSLRLVLFAAFWSAVNRGLRPRGTLYFLAAKSTKNSPADAFAYFVPSNVRNGRLFAGLQANRPRFLPLLAGTSFHGSGIGPGSFAAIPSFRPGKEANTRTCEQGRTSLVRLFAENPGIAPGSGFKPPHSRLQRRKHRM